MFKFCFYYLLNIYYFSIIVSFLLCVCIKLICCICILLSGFIFILVHVLVCMFQIKSIKNDCNACVFYTVRLSYDRYLPCCSFIDQFKICLSVSEEVLANKFSTANPLYFGPFVRLFYIGSKHDLLSKHTNVSQRTD